MVTWTDTQLEKPMRLIEIVVYNFDAKNEQ